MITAGILRVFKGGGANLTFKIEMKPIVGYVAKTLKVYDYYNICIRDSVSY